MKSETIKFAMWLTGHNEETIKQMFKDWERGEIYQVDYNPYLLTGDELERTVKSRKVRYTIG